MQLGECDMRKIDASHKRSWLTKCSRTDISGWLWVRVQGGPFERGFQYGSVTAKEYAEAVRVYEAMTTESTGKDLAFFRDKAVELQKDKIYPELLEEMEGLAAGYSDSGVPTTLDDIIGWNAWMEMTGYWWPWAQKNPAHGSPKDSSGRDAKSHCSAFIATGSATVDGKIVIGHQSFTEFWNGQYFNLILDITPDEGNRMVMQTSPGWNASMTDFWVTGAGLVAVETTIVGFRITIRQRSPSRYGHAKHRNMPTPSMNGSS